MTVSIDIARSLLDFGAQIGAGRQAERQLEGAVAIHNILQKQGVAYLADEVGMGKTFVALGAIALFRHFDPGFRVLVIAPKENIQRKWVKEQGNFIAHNLCYPDLRNCALDGKPARPPVLCENLIDFVHQAVVDPRRDFYLRLTSFSLGLSRDPEGWRKLRNRLRREVPWLPEHLFDLRSKDAFKDAMARSVCCALPEFDLVIVDEGHNLKHGFGERVAARNRVLGLVLGRRTDEPGDRALVREFRGYGPRAKRVLFLSATPLEESYRHVWNQLDVLGRGEAFPELLRDDLPEIERKEVLARILVRRVTTAHVAGDELTKNQYRREWRRGGVHRHDLPIRIEDDRQRLIVALVQKKVAELLGSEDFNLSFQIGMLASFESFLETARVKRETDYEGNFDGTEQTDDELEREGVDVRDVNRLTRRYRERFGAEMPHPKMDAVVEALTDSWRTGRKSLVFVRRIASVRELKRKLDERYDAWLIPSLRDRLPESARPRFDALVERYRVEKAEVARVRQERLARLGWRGNGGNGGRGAEEEGGGDGEGLAGNGSGLSARAEDDDRGGHDTFFAWFFRGDGPRGVISGANIQRRFIQSGATYATFFEDNHVMALLGTRPGGVLQALSEATGLAPGPLREEIRREAAPYLRQVKTHTGSDRMWAAQAAALSLLANRAAAIPWRVEHAEAREGTGAMPEPEPQAGDPGELQRYARMILREHYEPKPKPHALEAPDVADWLEQPTFFTELRRGEYGELREAIWPGRPRRDVRETFREREIRGQLLASAARLGHGLIDLYVLTIQRLGSLDARDLDSGETEPDGGARDGVPGTRVSERRRGIDDYLRLLDEQRRTPIVERRWGAYDELAEIARNYGVILDTNAPEARSKELGETARYFGSFLRQQQPVGGMSGQVNRTLVQQFRMPGYPFVLVTTDLLQEGEDLHTFCSSVYHYGISWTPSSMEQRIGRIDRVRSQTERRLAELARLPLGDELLQVYYPYLEETIEVLQVERVLERMDTFLRLMHEGLRRTAGDGKRIDVGQAIVGRRAELEPIRERLRSAFPVPEWSTRGTRRRLAIDPAAVAAHRVRFHGLASGPFSGLTITWEPESDAGELRGTVSLASGRIQPFALHLRSEGDRLLILCVSAVGQVARETLDEEIAPCVRAEGMRIVATPGRSSTRSNRRDHGGVASCPAEADAGMPSSRGEPLYHVRVEGDCLLGDPAHDRQRVAAMVSRVTSQADSLEKRFLPGADRPIAELEDSFRLQEPEEHD